MRGRTTGKIVTGVLIVLLGLMALFYVITGDTDSIDSARAITYGILSLVSATCYRYFED